MLSKALNVRPDEQTRVFLLLVHSFFIGLFVACYFTYANGAFLSRFELKMIPYAYIASGLAGYLSAFLFSYLQSRLPYAQLLVGVLCGIFFLTVLFRLFAFLPDDNGWLTFVMFIWAGPFLSLIGLQYWGMALKLFDLRQGKRLFGLIGSGDVVSSILGYLSMPFLLKLMEPVQLLWIGVVSLLVGLLFQVIIIGKFSQQLTTVAHLRKQQAADEKTEIKAIFKSRYFKLIAFLAVISLLGQYLVDYNFMGVFKGTFSQEELTQFIGVFFGIIKITELLTKTLVAGRLLNRYGLQLGLSALPVLLLIFTGIAIVSHPFLEEGFMFFLLISMNKLFDKVVRRGMEEPAFKALYQPFEGAIKMAFQTRIEGAVKQVGVIVAGGLLILVGLLPGFDVLQAHAAHVLFVILIIWLLLSRKTYEVYRALLTKRLSGLSEQQNMTGSDPVFSVELFRDHLLGKEEKCTLTALHLLERTAHGSSWPYLANLKKYPSRAVRAQATSIYEEGLGRLKSELDSATPVSEIETLARSQDPADRRRAAYEICRLKLDNFGALLGSLIKDPEVRMQEILEACEIGGEGMKIRQWVVDHLLENLKTDTSVFKPLIQSEQMLILLLKTGFRHYDGDAAEQWLESLYKAYSQQTQIVLSLIRGLSTTRAPFAQAFLKSKLSDSDMEIRHYALKGLSDSGYHAKTTDAFFHFKQLIFRDTATATWLLAAIHDLTGRSSFAELLTALEEQYQEIKENLFCLLAIMYDREAVDQIGKNLTSGLREKEALAIEMADVLLDEELKDIVFPVIDALPIPEKLKKLQVHFLQEKLNVTTRLKNIAYYDYSQINSYIKALALEALSSMGRSLPSEVMAHVYGKNIVLKEIAFLSLYQKHPEMYQAYLKRTNETERAYFDQINGVSGRRVSMLQKIKWLRQIPVFSELSSHIVLKLANIASLIEIDERDRIIFRETDESHILVVISGELQVFDSDGNSTHYRSREVFGLPNKVYTSDYSFKTSRDSDILIMDSRAFFAWVRVYDALARALLEGYAKEPEKTDAFLAWRCDEEMVM